MSESSSSEDDVLNLKGKLLQMFSDLDDADLNDLEQWISSSSYKNELKRLKSQKREEKKLDKVATALKKIVPLTAILPTENILVPSMGTLSDCLDVNTCHVDEFLYDDEEVEELVNKGEFCRHYCVQCGSRDVKDLTFISHSLSRQTLLYVFKVLLPGDLSNQQILDIGSRLGAVLYAGYYLSNASKIIGVEINKEFCNIQENIKTDFNLDSKRMRIVNSDILEQKHILENSNIIVINVFDFFLEAPKQIELWHFFKRHFQKGTYVVTVRSIAVTLDSLGILEEFMDWVSVSKPCQLENELLFDVQDKDFSDIHMYCVN